jgi:hypothetical protein
METSKIKREIVAVFMESPLYFTIPLKKRLEFIIFFSQKPVYKNMVELNQHLLRNSDLKPRGPTVSMEKLS